MFTYPCKHLLSSPHATNYESLPLNIETHKVCLLFRLTKAQYSCIKKKKVTLQKKTSCGLFWTVRSKGKVRPNAGHKGPEEEQKYSCTLSSTLALGGVGYQRHAPAALTLGKRPGTHCTGSWVCPRAKTIRCAYFTFMWPCIVTNSTVPYFKTTCAITRR
jgi:hypothetical protein